MGKNLVYLSAASALLFAAAFATSSSAGGLLGDAINTVAPGVGTALDKANADLGHPVDHAVAATAETFVPGSGVALEGAWAARGISGASSAGAEPASGPAIGAFCGTPFGRFGPGPAEPLGATCSVASPSGPVFGQIVP